MTERYGQPSRSVTPNETFKTNACLEYNELSQYISRLTTGYVHANDWLMYLLASVFFKLLTWYLKEVSPTCTTKDQHQSLNIGFVSDYF